jgi:hypothetical protein
MLPSDRYIAEILGLTEAQYRHFHIEARKRAAEGPQPAVTAEVATVLAIVNLVIGLGSLAVSLLLKPSAPKAPGEQGQPTQRQEEGSTVLQNSRFAPRYGFDSQQDIAALGSIIPIIYARKETISGTAYGGLRINTPMVWNQILSLGGGQMIRGVFLLGEGPISSVDPNNFAIGSSTLQGYIFDSNAATEAASRVTLYLSKDGGRIAGTDRIAGRSNVKDEGSSGYDGISISPDVFRVYWNGAEETDFCSSNRPSTQTTFGVYAPIGNDLMYKVNPVISPGVRSQTGPGGGDEVTVNCPVDAPKMNKRDKYRANFSTFSGVNQINSTTVTGSGTPTPVSVGDTVSYRLHSGSDWGTLFNTYGESDDDAEAKDVASAVASLQKTWDDRLVVGELYKIGTALCVCTGRTSAEFVSQAELGGSGGQSIVASFTVVEPGSIKNFSASWLEDAGGDSGVREKGTTGGHLLRYARGSVSTSRACQAVEVGLKSTLGIRINNLCNFRDTKTYQYADTQWCQTYENNPPEDIVNNFYQSGVITAPVQRYSFFKIKYRAIGGSNWTTLDNAYGVRSETQQSVFNYIRFEFSSAEVREFMFEPLSGFEVRQGYYGPPDSVLYVLDPKKGRATISDGGINVVFNGESVARNTSNFGITFGNANPALISNYDYEEDTNGDDPTVIRNYNGLPLVDATTYIDDYGKLAEAFVYSEISSSADSGPEHSIVYVNEIVPNSTVLLSAPATLTAGSTGPITVSVADAAYLADGTSIAGVLGTVYGTLSRSGTTYSFVSNQSYASDVTFANGTRFTAAPLYDNLALVGINIRSSAEFQQFSQFSAYVTGGRECTRLLGGSGATHLFPDILYDLMTNERFGAGSLVKSYMIDTTEFETAAQWCQDRKYFYDGAVSEPVNLRQWAADLAATHLLQFGESNSKYFLRPAISFAPVPIAALFTAGNIAADSFKLQYFDPEDRDPIQVSARYREERTTTDPTSPGLFPVVREVLVREVSASATDPIEQIDMSSYCTSREHAIDAAKFIIRMRRIPQHVINFSTTHEGVMSNIAPGDYIKVAIDETEYDQFNNGAVTPEGALVSTKALADGTHNVVAWDGTEGTPPADATLTVSNSGTTATPTGVVFTVKIASTQMRVYQIERITSGDDGLFTIEAMHMPVNSSGVLKVADGFDTASNWSIT